MPVDVIIYALVALVLVFWLRSVLGTRHGDEPSRPNPFATPPGVDGPVRPAALPLTDRARGVKANTPNVNHDLPRNMAAATVAESGLMDIARADKGFAAAQFMKGAQDAFTMIVEAYAAGDKATLRDLLADNVYEAFSGVIDQRERAGDKASVEILAVRKMEILNAEVRNKTQASITIRYTADETWVLRDSAGTVKEGHPDRVSEAIDIWTFTRDLKGRNKNQTWLVSETREEEAPADSTPPPAVSA